LRLNTVDGGARALDNLDLPIVVGSRKNLQPRRRNFSPGCERVVFEFDGPMRLEAVFDATAN
jgi:hypothetical protein